MLYFQVQENIFYFFLFIFYLLMVMQVSILIIFHDSIYLKSFLLQEDNLILYLVNLQYDLSKLFIQDNHVIMTLIYKYLSFFSLMYFFQLMFFILLYHLHQLYLFILYLFILIHFLLQIMLNCYHYLIMMYQFKKKLQ